jgi:hypothetical protein
MKNLVLQSRVDFANTASRQFSDTVYALVLSQNSEDHVTIPSGATGVIMCSTANYFCKVGPTGTTASVPSMDITDGSASELNSSGYELSASDKVISCITNVSGGAIVTLAFYS